MMHILSYDQAVRLPGWGDTEFATVFTVRGYAAQNGMNPDEYEERARGNGHALAGTIYSSGALVGDRALAARMRDERRARAAGALTLTAGAIVQIYGRRYRVVVNAGNDGPAPRNSDPIAFKPMEG